MPLPLGSTSFEVPDVQKHAHYIQRAVNALVQASSLTMLRME
jgi:hypothetical protein